MSRFNDAFRIIVGHEGGFTADRNDRGNWTSGIIGVGQLKGTKYGISAMSYPTLDIRNLTLEDARAIYKAHYWDAIDADNLPDSLALAAFDTAVNSGVGRARQFLAQTHDWRRFLDIRLQFMQSLSAWARYGRGWQRRVDTLRQQCAAWEVAPAPVLAPPAQAAPAAPTTRQIYAHLRNPDGTSRTDAVSITVDAQGRLMLGADNKPRAYYMTAEIAAAKGVK